MNALQKLMKRRDDAEGSADGAQARARELALSDPDAAAAALKEAHDASIDAEVAAMAVAEQERIDAEDAESQELAARARAERELRDVSGAQNGAAQRFDAAAARLQAAFDELEQLNSKAEDLRRLAHLPAKRDFTARTVGLTRAMWHGCPGVAKRLRLGFAPGRGRAPLADAYPKER